MIELFILLLFAIIVLFTPSTKSCNKCGKTMYSKTYIGDGDGPAPDHIIYECSSCGHTEEVLQ